MPKFIVLGLGLSDCRTCALQQLSFWPRPFAGALATWAVLHAGLQAIPEPTLQVPAPGSAQEVWKGHGAATEVSF